MKILQVNCVYQKGSTGKIVHDIHKILLANGIESIVCYGRGKLVYERGIYKFCTELESKIYHLLNKFGWLMYRVCPFGTRRLINIIRKERPDIVHLHCINGYCVDIYKLCRYLAMSKIKTVVTHHAEFFYTGSCGHAYGCTRYQMKSGCFNCPIRHEATGTSIVDRTSRAWKLMRDTFDYFEKQNLSFVAVSPWVAGRSSLSPICNKFNCNWVINGVDTNVFTPSTLDKVNSIRSCLPNSRQKLILHVTAYFTTNKNNIKGGAFIKQLAEMMTDYQFVVVANSIGHVEDLPLNLYMWGQAESQDELATLYTAANLTVIASKRETFSMVVAESLCCGTPVVGYESGGPESIALPEYSEFVEYGSIEKLRMAIERQLARGYNACELSRLASLVYSKESMGLGYINLYNELLDGV